MKKMILGSLICMMSSLSIAEMSATDIKDIADMANEMGRNHAMILANDLAKTRLGSEIATAADLLEASSTIKSLNADLKVKLSTIENSELKVCFQAVTDAVHSAEADGFTSVLRNAAFMHKDLFLAERQILNEQKNLVSVAADQVTEKAVQACK